MTASKRDFLRLLNLSDTHCGHITGLTHPDFDSSPNKRHPAYKLYTKRRLHWDILTAEIKSLQPIDILTLNGDAIDGRGEKSGGIELIAPDRNEQVDMVLALIDLVNAPIIRLTYGTDYHVGISENWEDQIAKRCGATIADTQDLDVRGLKFNLKHHIGGSQSPITRASPLIRERLWNLLWSEHGEYDKADILVRGHVHYHVAVQQYGWLALIAPACQGYGTRYGKRRMSGTVDFGFVYFDIYSKSKWSWESVIWKRKEFGSTSEKLR